MRSHPEVTCIGETIVDFVSTRSGVGLSESPGFRLLAGGAPANVAVGVSKLGISSAFVGKVGDDPFGRFLIRQLKNAKVDVRDVRRDPGRKTRLAFVSLTRDGGREFEYWEKEPADEHLRRAEMHLRRLARSRIVHISSFLLLKNPARSAVLQIAKELRARRVVISFDPNLRLSLWKSRPEAQRVVLTMCDLSTILKLNEDEATFLSGSRNLKEAMRILAGRGPRLIVVTRGERGCRYECQGFSGSLRAVKVDAVDTTGCGDAFLAALLSGIVMHRTPIGDLTKEDLDAVCMRANAAGALTALRHGAEMPTAVQLQRFMREHSVW